MHARKIIKTSLNLFAGAYLALLAGNVMAQRSLSDSTIAKLKLGVEGFQERYQSPSIAVAIVHGDTIIFSDARGFVDLESEIPATIDSRYQIQSITKIFTATMFMQLWEQGIIDGDDRVSTYVPEFPGDATFLELATHNAGLPRNSPADVGFARQVDRWLLTKADEGPIQSAETGDFISSLAHVSQQYLSYEFLSQDARHYSNLGYGLLGVALERATGMEYEAYVVEQICNPMGLADTGFGTVRTADNPLAKGYFYRGDSLGFIRTPDYFPRSMVPAAGMYSTARDLARFISAQFGSHQATLSAKSCRMMQQLGIGWMRNYPFIVHEGSMLGARAEIVFHPKLRIGWVVLANTTDFPFNRINDYIASLIVPVYTAKPIVDLEKYVGTYVLQGGYGELEIHLKDGKLYSTYLQDMLPDEALHLTGAHSLTAEGIDGHDIRYEFIADAGTEITGLSLNQLLWTKQRNGN